MSDNMSDKMYGVVNGLYYCGINESEELSKRFRERNIPSAPLEARFSLRPTSTKYNFMPIVNDKVPSTTPVQCKETYNMSTTFNPGTAQGPWSGFATNINVESELRNQNYALQRSEAGIYVPPSNSDMYHVQMGESNDIQPHPALFYEERFEAFNPNTCGVGYNIFDNNTRVQLKDIN